MRCRFITHRLGQSGVLIGRCLLALFASLIFSSLSLADDEPLAQIQQIFPKATVIGDKEKAFPVWPVYQLQQLIGYAFQSNDLVDLPGFSGDPINLLIGIDTAGQFAGFRVLHHHEPIFLHGLGPQPMFSFIEQYIGRRVSDRIIVGGAHSNSTSQNEHETVYFDGVTKATVSVIVINDTILSSALQVARKKLSEFAQDPPAKVKTDVFEPMDWSQLTSQGYIKHWALSQTDIETGLGSALDEFPSENFSGPPNEQGIHLYYGYLNAPVIGRNLLGDSEYNRLLAMLKANQHAIAIMSEGFFPYLEKSFRPGTVPDRVSLLQHGLPVTIRDLNFFDLGGRSLPNTRNETQNMQIFRINSQSGFDPSSPWSLLLNMKLAKNHLVSNAAIFSDEYHLPTNLFDIMETRSDRTALRAAPWVQVWQNRTTEIIILCLSLVVLTVAFIQQNAISKKARLFHYFRWAFLFFTLLFIGFYAQGQLSVVNIYTLLLKVINGFSFDVFLLDPILFILWIYTAISLVLWGRGLFCGWLCPFGALQEMLSWLAKKVGIQQIQMKTGHHNRLLLLKYFILIGLLAISLYSLNLAEKLAEIEPFKTAITLLFMRSWPFAGYALLLLGLGMFIHKFYCRYLCPLGAGLAIIGKFRRFEWLNRRSECGTPCQLCRHRCEINAIHRNGTINYDECIQCLECIVIINDERQCAPARVALKNTTQTEQHNIAVFPGSL